LRRSRHRDFGFGRNPKRNNGLTAGPNAGAA
jgi:hypothetical protein